MPWHVEQREGKFCVIKDTDGQNHGCHATRAKAEAQMRALYASEKSMAEVYVQGYGVLDLLVAETIRERALGLASRDLDDLIAQGVDGMLFVYPTETFASFHMENMRFDLLVAFFDAAGGLVDQRIMPPGGGVFRPQRPFKYVVELALSADYESPSSELEVSFPADARLVLPLETGRSFSGEKRRKLADQHKALPDGSFPIENVADLKNAIQAIGRAKDPAKAKAHIKRRAKALGATNLLPEGW